MRIVAGKHRGRQLAVPQGSDIRPTADRVREAMFNSLCHGNRRIGDGDSVRDAIVLDGFAGTGAVGIEALSRGADHVTFIESDRRACALVAGNLERCRVSHGYTIHPGDVTRVMAGGLAGRLYDLILLDPPYGASEVSRAISAASSRLTPGGLLVLERATRGDRPDLGPLTHVRDIRSGDSTLTIAERVE